MFIALGGTAAAQVVIRSNSQVGSNTISGHAGSAGNKNIIPKSVGGKDLAPTVKESLTLHCPGDLQRAADLCFEPSLRPAATWTEAVELCARAQRRLPDAGELGLVFDHLGASQEDQWITTPLNVGPKGEAVVLGDDNARNILVAFSSLNVADRYRCVTSVTN